MRKLTFLLLVMTALGSVVGYGQSDYTPTKADAFVKYLLHDHAKATSCRNRYDPTEAVLRFDIRDGQMRKWEEPDRKEPGVENHMMEWQFPGTILTTSTWFSFYGPSTWLHSLKLTSPTELTGELSFGDSVGHFARNLGVPESTIRSRRTWYDGASVTFEVAEDDTVTSLLLECIAD